MLFLAAWLLAQTAGVPAPHPAAPAPAAGWSTTTREAASTPANQAWLQSGRPATLTGEVLDLSCYLQLGKRGPAHKACGALCVAHGEPAGLLTADGKVYLLLPEQHHPRRDGQVSLAKLLSEKMGETLTVSGMLMTQGPIPTLYVEAPAGK